MYAYFFLQILQQINKVRYLLSMYNCFAVGLEPGDSSGGEADSSPVDGGAGAAGPGGEDPLGGEGNEDEQAESEFSEQVIAVA